MGTHGEYNRSCIEERKERVRHKVNIINDILWNDTFSKARLGKIPFPNFPTLPNKFKTYDTNSRYRIQ